MGLAKTQRIEAATWLNRQEILRLGVSILFVVCMIGGYMAFNIGANDVANAVSPLTAISDALTTRGVSTSTSVPLWVMIVGRHHGDYRHPAGHTSETHSNSSRSSIWSRLVEGIPGAKLLAPGSTDPFTAPGSRPARGREVSS